MNTSTHIFQFVLVFHEKKTKPYTKTTLKTSNNLQDVRCHFQGNITTSLNEQMLYNGNGQLLEVKLTRRQLPEIYNLLTGNQKYT